MGIYCIAAGSASNNRLKTLDRSYSIADIEAFLPSGDIELLQEHFPDGRSIFLWGAGANRLRQLRRVRRDEYVIDFNNQRVDKVFRFCFVTSTGSDTRLQRFVGWDEDSRSTIERRPYPCVYFLKNPMRPRNRDKRFFLKAFDAERTPHFFDGQKYLDDLTCAEALRRTGSSSLEELLGLTPGGPQPPSAPQRVREPEPRPRLSAQPPPTIEHPPTWLRPVIETVDRLWVLAEFRLMSLGASALAAMEKLRKGVRK